MTIMKQILCFNIRYKEKGQNEKLDQNVLNNI